MTNTARCLSGWDSFEISNLLEHALKTIGFGVAGILLIFGWPATVILIEKAARTGPDRLRHAKKMFLHLRRGRFPESHHVFHLCSRRVRVFPGTTHHVEVLHREVNGR